MRDELIPLVASISIIGASGAAADPAANSPEADAILKPALSSLENSLRKPAKLHTEGLHSSDGWAFLYAKIQNPNGKDFSYQGTPFAEAALHGGKSDTYAGLLRQQHDGQWNLVASAIGPTDMAWDDWSHEYGAPRAIFKIPED